MLLSASLVRMKTAARAPSSRNSACPLPPLHPPASLHRPPSPLSLPRRCPVFVRFVLRSTKVGEPLDTKVRRGWSIEGSFDPQVLLASTSVHSASAGFHKQIKP